MDYISYLHLPVDGHMGAALQELAQHCYDIICEFECGHIFSSLGHIYLGVELLGSMSIFFFFETRSCSAAQSGFEHRILLPQPPLHSDHRYDGFISSSAGEGTQGPDVSMSYSPALALLFFKVLLRHYSHNNV